MSEHSQSYSLERTANRPIEEWGKLIGDVPAATAILDRFLHHAEIIQITGKSYRIGAGGKDKRPNAVELICITRPACRRATYVAGRDLNHNALYNNFPSGRLTSFSFPGFPFILPKALPPSHRRYAQHHNPRDCSQPPMIFRQ